MAQKGLCSRREADELISRGLVKVNGVIESTLGVKIPVDSAIELLPLAEKELSQKVSIALYKPVGYVSNLPEKDYKPAIRLISTDTQDSQFESRKKLKYGMLQGLAVAGRLDIDSRGLLIFTQDGVLAKKIVGESSEIEKEYIVQVTGDIDENGMDLLQHGLEIDGSPLKQAVVKWVVPNKRLKFILKEGKKRQIRQMCEQVGLRVLSLQRIRVGNIKLGKLKEGHWRFIDPDEL